AEAELGRAAPARTRGEERSCGGVGGGEATAAADRAAGGGRHPAVRAATGVRDVRGPPRRASPRRRLARDLPREPDRPQLAGGHVELPGHAVQAGARRAAIPPRLLQATGDGGACARLRPHCSRLGQHRQDPPTPRPGRGHPNQCRGRRLRAVAPPGPCLVRPSRVPHPLPAVVVPVMVSSAVTALNHILICWA
ncbi:hypothetical protein CFC21_111373, partial [Triticum aestivum]